jgi:GT2 family glycosyltransferase
LISIILLLWKNTDYLFDCLNALSAQTHQKFEIILMDNGSSEGALDGLSQKYPDLDLHLYKLETNFGYAVASNMGIGYARGKYLALLNVDAFPEPDWLERLLEVAESNSNAFFTSRQIQFKNPDYLDGEGDNYHVSGYAWRNKYASPVYQLNKPQEVFSACGAAAFYPRQAFLDAGGFDEDYFSYHEDVDLGFRLRLRGLSCFLVPQAVVHHVGSASTGKRSDFSVYYGHRNLVWTYFKNMPLGLFWLYLPLHIVVNFFFLIYFTLKGQGRVIWCAKLDALRGLPAMLKKRQAVQRDRQVSAAEIHRMLSRNWFTPFLAFLKRKSE